MVYLNLYDLSFLDFTFQNSCSSKIVLSKLQSRSNKIYDLFKFVRGECKQSSWKVFQREMLSKFIENQNAVELSQHRFSQRTKVFNSFRNQQFFYCGLHNRIHIIKRRAAGHGSTECGDHAVNYATLCNKSNELRIMAMVYWIQLTPLK